MPRLADEPVDARILVVTIAAFDVRHGAVPNRGGVLRLALAIDHVEQKPVDGDRIGAEHHLLWIKAEFTRWRKWPAVPHAAQSVHDGKHGTRAQRLDTGQRTD